jgi:GT2 family glycosyltransferase
MERSQQSVELVIPSYNRLAVLAGTLARIRTLYPDLRICLGLQGNMPEGDFQALLKNDSHMRMEIMASPGTTVTLNQCVRTSRADIVLILDDDSVPCFGWLEAHEDAFLRDSALAYTTGREVRTTRGRTSFSELVRIVLESVSGLFIAPNRKINGRIVGWTTRSGLIFGNFDQPGSCLINAPRGCNMGLRRDQFLQAGGFNGRFRGNAWGFEAEFGLRMARLGKLGRYVGDAVVTHLEISSGGSRQAKQSEWFDDFLHNHRLLIEVLGPQAWLGSLPRLVKKRIFS